MYNKLFTKILDSTIWLAPDTQRLVWITLIAAMDEDSIARFAAPENLAIRARVSVKACKAALKAFESPDPHGLHQENEGRRIERIPDGWLVLNGQKYREIVTKIVERERTKERVRKWRERHNVTASNGRLLHVTASNARNDSVTPSEAVSEAISKSEAEKKTTASATPREAPPPEFSKFKLTYPARSGSPEWGRAMKAIRARLKDGHTWDEIIDGANRYMDYIVAIGKLNTEFVKQAATFCGPEKHFLESWNTPTTRAENRMTSNINAALEAKRQLFGEQK